MSSSCDPQHAPVGDVGAALMLVDSRLKAVHGESSQASEDEKALTGQLFASMDPSAGDELFDGVCTLIYMYAQWLRQTHEQHDKDVIEYVVPTLVATMRLMPKSIPPNAIPTMAGLVTAACMDLSPNLWRRQYGYWTRDEMNPLEATAFLLAEHINRITDDSDFAIRLITEAVSSALED